VPSRDVGKDSKQPLLQPAACGGVPAPRTMHGSSVMSPMMTADGSMSRNATSHGSSPASSHGKEMGLVAGSTRNGTSWRMIYRVVSRCTCGVARAEGRGGWSVMCV
jgi:hypothetical protein